MSRCHALPPKAKALVALLVSMSFVPAGPAAETPPAALSDLSMEDLLAIDVVLGVSRYAQRTSEAPASITIVTSDDIHRFGYRTIEEVLSGVRGIYTTYDRNYSYLGVRGFQRPGDYNTRVLLLIDGHRMNENVYSAGYVGTEQFLDVESIERIEVIRGPSSSVYGTGAFLAVLNIVTRPVTSAGETQIAMGGGSFAMWQARASHAARLADGAELTVSASGSDSGGQSLFYEEFDDPSTNDGRVDHDGDRYGRFHARYRRGNLTVTGGHARRSKEYPTAAFGTIFNDARAGTVDERTFADARYDRALRGGDHLTLRLSADRYWYRGRYPFDYPPVTVYSDEGYGAWVGLEGNVRTRPLGRHRLIAGTDLRLNLRQDIEGYDESPHVVYADEPHHSTDIGLYLEDEWQATGRLRIQAGVRYDDHELFGSSLNPRVALMARAGDASALKLIYGTAFRAPNIYELFYNDSGFTFKRSGGLDPETIETWETVFEHEARRDLRFTAAVYQLTIDDLISLTTDPGDGLLVFRNVERVRGRGIEVEVEKRWNGGARIRLSHAFQRTRDLTAAAEVSNSPRHLTQVHFARPLVAQWLDAALEVVRMSERRTPKGGRERGHLLANLTFTGRLPGPGLEFSIGVRNLLDEEYGDPGSEEHDQDSIPRDGRSVRAFVTKRF